MRFELNGKTVDIDAMPMKRLLDVLRDECALPGTKEGCGEGECGACSVLVDGAVVNACLVPFAQVGGARVRTIEGFGGAHPLQAAFVACGGAQCGICTPGMIVAASVIAPGASRDEVRDALAGNLCRCTGYEAIYRSVEAAAKAAPKARTTRGRRGKAPRS